MKTSRLLSLLLALTMMLTSLTAAFAEETAAAADDTLLATVNGVEIHASDVTGFYDYLVEYYEYQGYDMSQSENQSVIRAWAMQDAVQNALISAYAKENGLDVLTEDEEKELSEEASVEWASALDSYIQYFANDPENMTEAEAAQLKINAEAYYLGLGYTKEILKEELRAEVVKEKAKAELCKDVLVSDDEIQAAYDSRVAESRDYAVDASTYEIYGMFLGYTLYYTPESYRAVKQILLPADETLMDEYTTLSALWEEQAEGAENTPTDLPAADAQPVTYEQVEAAEQAVLASVQPVVDEIKAKLEEGVTFDELIEAYGTDEMMGEEPYATEGYKVHMDSITWPPALIKAAFSLENVGDVSEPVLDADGVHIVQYVADVPSGAVPLNDELRADLYASVLQEKEDAIYQSTLDSWIRVADITYTADGEAWQFNLAEPETPASPTDME